MTIMCGKCINGKRKKRARSDILVIPGNQGIDDGVSFMHRHPLSNKGRDCSYPVIQWALLITSWKHTAKTHHNPKGDNAPANEPIMRIMPCTTLGAPSAGVHGQFARMIGPKVHDGASVRKERTPPWGCSRVQVMLAAGGLALLWLLCVGLDSRAADTSGKEEQDQTEISL